MKAILVLFLAVSLFFLVIPPHSWWIDLLCALNVAWQIRLLIDFVRTERSQS